MSMYHSTHSAIDFTERTNTYAFTVQQTHYISRQQNRFELIFEMYVKKKSFIANMQEVHEPKDIKQNSVEYNDNGALVRHIPHYIRVRLRLCVAYIFEHLYKIYILI